MSGEECFVQGNEACVRGALYAGLKFFAGYPITPSTEMAELLRSCCRVTAVILCRWKTSWRPCAPSSGLR